MFSGIIKGVGRIVESDDRGGDRRAVISYEGAPLAPPEPGASIAVNGICLTATEVSAEQFAVDVSAETLRATNFGELATGSRVNLEGALRVGDPVDGHLVSGHVDEVGRVVALKSEARSLVLEIEVSEALARFIAVKGSVAVDGVSLTVNQVNASRFEVNIVPHTSAVTLIGDYECGTRVNIEVDMLARYVDRMVDKSP